MRCKKHITDVSSTIGVCASCLRGRLFVIIEAQVREDRRRRIDKDADNPPLQFPRSVSPYVSHRKSDGLKIGTWQNQHHHHHHHQGEIHDQRFFSTPQVGPGGEIVGGVSKKKTGFGFRSKPEKLDVADLDRNNKDTGKVSRWWLVRMLFGRRRRTNTTASSMHDPENGDTRRVCRKDNKGMSPARNSDEEDEHWDYDLSGPFSELSKQCQETPKRTPVWIAPGKRGGHNRNGSGIGFCLSPLVRASPSRQWNQKGIPPEMVVSGDMKVVPVKPSPTHPAAFNKNRSRKMADFGRCHHNR